MNLAIMQPYFFPYLGYFSLIAYADRFVLFDTPQFIRHGWIERNRILKPESGWQYVKVPLVKVHRGTPIREVRLRDEAWRERILRQLDHYRKAAPFFSAASNLVQRALDIDTTSIAELDRHALQVVCDHLAIETRISLFSEMELVTEAAHAPDEWALVISKAMGALQYVNPPGGRSFFNPEKYRAAGIELRFLETRLTPYDQRRSIFEPGLSIIDVLMWNDIETTRAFIADHVVSG
jgi:hypothetical protein